MTRADCPGASAVMYANDRRRVSFGAAVLLAGMSARWQGIVTVPAR